MAYRQIEHHHHHENRTAQKLTTPARFYITNGSTFDLGLPCWYHEIHKPIRARHHCRDWHDHVGQPDPMHPDHVCQDYDFASVHCHGQRPGHHPPPYVPNYIHGHVHRHAFNRIDMAKLIPIHLLDEGYETAEVSFEPKIPNLEAEAWIDEADDWIIRVHFIAQVDMEEFKPMSTKFAVRVYNSDKTICDVAAIAEVIVMPAAR